jgi:hypothetical protein
MNMTFLFSFFLLFSLPLSPLCFLLSPPTPFSIYEGQYEYIVYEHSRYGPRMLAVPGKWGDTNLRFEAA